MNENTKTIRDLAAYVCDRLAGKVLIHRYDAYSTNSVYLKFDYGVANSLRIADHAGKEYLSYTATSGTQNTADLSDIWLRLLTGSHVLKIYVTDGAGGSATRLITFSRTVTRIAASRAIATDAKVEKVFLSLYPADHPADATLHVEVTNNPFDDSPAWEDITSKVGKFVHTFTNTTVASSSYGLAYRFYMTKGTQEIEVIQATVRFA